MSLFNASYGISNSAAGRGGTLVTSDAHVGDASNPKSVFTIEEYASRSHPEPRIVAMDRRQTQHQEAYYLFFVGSFGMALNILVIALIFYRRNLRRMTSAFLIHDSFLNLVKAGFCIQFGMNLLSNANENKDNQPTNCMLQGSAFIIMVTTSAFNMVAMVCAEAYTFGEVNVGGNSHGTTCCILFGILVVYITGIILHLGPTLIGGDILYNPDIGSCAFKLGSVTGYVANVMWIIIITLALVGVGHFLNKFYKEIQMNRPNRVSMLVRHSITISNEQARKPSGYTVHELTMEASHRATIFVMMAVAFVLCWYPFFLLILIDMHFKVSPKVYQAFSFIAWTQSLVEPIILIFFDRNLNLLSRFMYCDRDQYTASQIAYLLRQRQQQQLQQDEERCPTPDPQDLGASAAHMRASMELAEAFSNLGGTHDISAQALITPPCRHHHHHHHHSSVEDGTLPQCLDSHFASSSASATPVTSSTHELRGFRHANQPLEDAHNGSFEMNFIPVRGDYNPLSMEDVDGQYSGDKEDDVQC